MLLTCRAVAAHLDDHGHDEERVGARLARACVSLHLALCGDCYRYLGQLRAVRAALALVGAEPAVQRPVGARTKEQLAAKFRAWHASLPGKRAGDR